MWFFDCDGVLLDSNAVKSDAFHAVALRYGPDVADAVLAHHLANGGLSRFVKLERIFTELLHRPATSGEYEELLDDFAARTRQSLSAVSADAAAVDVLSRLRRSDSALHVVSGGQQDEVRWALGHHGLAGHFDGIHGSPNTKSDIISRILDDTGARPGDCVVVGDSRLDMTVGAEFGLERIFVSHWTEFADWREYVAAEQRVLVVRDLGELHDLLAGDLDLDPLRDLDWLRSFG